MKYGKWKRFFVVLKGKMFFFLLRSWERIMREIIKNYKEKEGESKVCSRFVFGNKKVIRNMFFVKVMKEIYLSKWKIIVYFRFYNFNDRFD